MRFLLSGCRLHPPVLSIQKLVVTDCRMTGTPLSISVPMTPYKISLAIEKSRHPLNDCIHDPQRVM